MQGLVDYYCNDCGAELTPVLGESDAKCPECGAALSPLKMRATTIDFYGHVCAGVSLLVALGIGFAGYWLSESISWFSDWSPTERILVVVLTAIVSGFVAFAAAFGYTVYFITGSAGSVGTMLLNVTMLGGFVVGIGLCISGLILVFGMQQFIAGVVLIGMVLLGLFGRRRRRSY